MWRPLLESICKSCLFETDSQQSGGKNTYTNYGIQNRGVQGIRVEAKPTWLSTQLNDVKLGCKLSSCDGFG